MTYFPPQSGPCVICGDTNYGLSCGGPTICPKCDCGNFDAATVEKQAKVIAQLRSDLSDTEAQLDAFGKVSPGQYQKEIDALIKALKAIRQVAAGPAQHDIAVAECFDIATRAVRGYSLPQAQREAET